LSNRRVAALEETLDLLKKFDQHWPGKYTIQDSKGNNVGRDHAELGGECLGYGSALLVGKLSVEMTFQTSIMWGSAGEIAK